MCYFDEVEGRKSHDEREKNKELQGRRGGKKERKNRKVAKLCALAVFLKFARRTGEQLLHRESRPITQIASL